MARKVLILAEDLYDERELWYPSIRMKEEGYDVVIVGTGEKEIYHSKLGMPVKEDCAAGQVDFDFDALIIPGGFAPDRLRRFDDIKNLVRRAMDEGKVVATICHGGWVLVSAGVLKGRTATSFMAIKDDMVNAGVTYVDEAVVVDGNLITSRTPNDLHVFMPAIINALR